MLKMRCFSSGDEAMVRVVHAVDPHDFHIRLVEDDDWISTFQNLVETQPPPMSLRSPSTEQPVLLQHERYGWVRGMVTRIEANGLLCVQTLDYGEALMVKPEVIRRLDFANATTPKAIHCRLHRCEPTYKLWTTSSVDAFIHYVGTGPLKMTVIKLTPTGDQYVVELCNNYDTISKMLVISGMACLGGHPQEINRLEANLPVPLEIHNYFKYSFLTVGKETNVRILKVQRDKMYVIREEMYEGIPLTSDLVEAEFEDCKPLDATSMEIGTPVVFHRQCRGKEVYYRAEILTKKLHKNGKYLLKILLVDHGGIETLITSAKRIRKCNSLLLELETLAIICKLNMEQRSQYGIHSLLASGLRLVVRAESPKEGHIEAQTIHIVEGSLSKVVK